MSPRRKTPNRPRGRGRGSERRGARIKVAWHELGPRFDFWGEEFRRFYHLDTLAHAVEGTLGRTDKFILPSIQSILGPAPVTTLRFELFQEGQWQLIFRVRATNAKGKQGTFALVAAKSAEEHSKVAVNELSNLKTLYRRAPEFVVRPFQGGYVFLPDRHGRPGHGRKVFVYMTQWLGGYHELGIQKNLQLFVNVKQPQAFPKEQTEYIKSKMVEVVLRTYHPRSKDCMAIPQVASGDFVVTKPGKSNPRVRLIACRDMLQNMTPAKLLDRIVRAEWPWGTESFRFVPADPACLKNALICVWGPDKASQWLAGYLEAIRAGRAPETQWLDVARLEKLV